MGSAIEDYAVELLESGFSSIMVADFFNAVGVRTVRDVMWTPSNVLNLTRGREIKFPTLPEWAKELKKSWASAKARCFNPNNQDYHNYGARGITMREPWVSNFSAFAQDMGPKPGPEFTLERIDVDGDYEPGNCRWASVKEQMSNKRTNVWLTINGETKTQEQWAIEFSLDPAVIVARRRRGLVGEALIAPVRGSDLGEIIALRKQGLSFAKIGEVLGKTGEAVSISYRDWLFKTGNVDPQGKASPRPRKGL